MQRNNIKLAQKTKMPYDPISEIFEQVPVINKQRRQEGLEDIIGLNVGEPHLPISPLIPEALSEFLSTPQATTSFSYSPLAGTPPTLEAISRLYGDYYKVTYSQDEVMICNGATQGIWNALNIFLDPGAGDEVAAFEPYYGSYNTQVHTSGGKLVKIPTSQDHFQPTATQLDEFLSTHPKVKALILNYPNNPTGIDLTENVAKEMAAVLHRYPHVAIIMDDVYRELTPDEHFTILNVDPSLKDRCVVVNSVSKSLIGAPGLRGGMVGANADWILHMLDIQASNTSSMPNLNQLAVQKGINDKLDKAPEYTDWLAKSKEAYAENIQYVAEQIKSLGLNSINGGCGLFLLVDASHLIGQAIPDVIQFESCTGKKYSIDNLHKKVGASVFQNDKQIASYFLYAAGVAVVPGCGFGIDETAGYLRFSCAKNKSVLEKAMFYIKQAVDSVASLQLEKEAVVAPVQGRPSLTGLFAPPIVITAPTPDVRPAPSRGQPSNWG